MYKNREAYLSIDLVKNKHASWANWYFLIFCTNKAVRVPFISDL